MKNQYAKIVLLLFSLLGGAVVLGWKLMSTNMVYEISGRQYVIPDEYLGPFARRSSNVWGSGEGFDPEGPITFVYFSNEELGDRFPRYIAKYGEQGFNTTFSVMVFTSNKVGTFQDDFLYFLPESGVGVDVEYDIETTLYTFRREDNPYDLFLGTINPYQSGFDGIDKEIFIRCWAWTNEIPAGWSCSYTLKREETFFNFRVSFANLGLLHELTDYFFTKLDSWRVED
jgi:hypothetical protein